MIGKALSHYEIKSQLAKGGMIVALGLLRAGVTPDSARHVATRSRGTPQVDRVGELFVDVSIRRIYGGVATWYTSDVFCTSGNAVKLDPSKRRIAKTDMM